MMRRDTMTTLNSKIKEVLLEINSVDKLGIPQDLIEQIIDIEYDELDNQTKAIANVHDAVNNYLKKEE